MRAIEASVEYLPQGEGLQGILTHIERVARVCYKSEDKMGHGEMTKRLIDSGHYAMLEHGSVGLLINDDTLIDKYRQNPYSQVEGHFVSTNYRVIIENHWKRDLDFLINVPLRRYTLKFTISRAIANELVRHRVFSFAQESTRFCNYSKDKFDNEITCILPSSKLDEMAMMVWEEAMRKSEEYYLHMLNYGAKPQVARGVLPLDLKTELVMTGTFDQWLRLIDIRYNFATGKAHPDCQYIIGKAKDLLFSLPL